MSEEYTAKSSGRKPNAFMPVFGLVIGLCFAGIAYFAAPLVIDNLNNFEQFASKTENVEEMVLRVSIAAAMWIILFSFAMFLVAMVAGGDSLVDREQKTVLPKGKKMTKRKLARHQRKLDQNRRKRLEALKRMRDKQKKETGE